MNLRCLIVDDEPLAHKVILKYAEDVPDLEIVGQCYLATEALTFLHHEEVDLIFLDINMPKLTGLEFLRTLNRAPAVIITSAHEEHALESYDLDVVDYLHKPYRFSRFLRAIEKVRSRTTTSSAEVVTQAKTHLFVKADKRTVNVLISGIEYLESYGNYVKLFQQGKYLLTPQTLTGVTAELPSESFFRVHKSYTVNWHFIDYTEGNMVHMKDGVEIPIGKNYRVAFKGFFRA